MRLGLTSVWTATAVAVAVFFTAIAASPIDTTDPVGRQYVIEIRDFEFTPRELVVAPGDTIMWVNYDLVPHTVTADDESWDSGLIGAQGQWQMVVLADMYATYFCRYHPTMKARLVVARP